MKKILSLVLALAMMLTLVSIASADPLTASVAGFGGDVTVTVELDADGVITAISADGSTQTPNVGGAAAETLNGGALAALAGTKLADVDVSAIDTVSGATVTSTAIKTAIEIIFLQTREHKIIKNIIQIYLIWHKSWH